MYFLGLFASKQCQDWVVILASQRILVSQVPAPLGFLFPAVANGTSGYLQLTVRIHLQWFPFTVFLIHKRFDIGGAQEPTVTIHFVFFVQHYQERKIGVSFNVVMKVFTLPVDIVFLQNHMDASVKESTVSPFLNLYPEIGKLSNIRVIG